MDCLRIERDVYEKQYASFEEEPNLFTTGEVKRMPTIFKKKDLLYFVSEAVNEAVEYHLP